jgi:hypothetical protein
MCKCDVEAVNLHVCNVCFVCSEQVSVVCLYTVYVGILAHICAYMHQGIVCKQSGEI